VSVFPIFWKSAAVDADAAGDVLGVLAGFVSAGAEASEGGSFGATSWRKEACLSLQQAWRHFEGASRK
jgi:hypothetical protein